MQGTKNIGHAEDRQRHTSCGYLGTGVLPVKAAAGVAKHYALDDLDPEWHALLNELDDRLIMQVP